ADTEALRSPVTEESYGAALRVTVPVFDSTAVASGAPPVAAVVAEVRLGDLIRDADEREAQEPQASARGGTASATTRPARRTVVIAIALACVACLAALALLLVIARHETRDIERVARGASAIAAGNLDQRIEVSATGETKDLAASFNLMTDRLRELIAREAESRQFQSFLRISAMISHDLKNAIAASPCSWRT